MVPLIGYADRLSVRPGETISFKVSSAEAEPYQASLVRVVRADPNPAGPGLHEIPVEAAFAGSYPSRQQAVPMGSYARVENAPALPLDEGAVLMATIWPTLPTGGTQVILAVNGFRLEIDENGSTSASLEPFGESLGLAL